MTAALEAGSIELSGAGTITDVFTLSKVDPSVRILGALSNGFVVDVVVGKSFEQQAHLTTNSPLDQKIKALLGKKIGTTGAGTGTEAMMTYLFKMYGYDAKHDVTLVGLGGNPAAGLAALSKGSVDAISFPVPIGQEAAAQNVGDILISPDRGDIATMQGQINCVFFAKQKLLADKPQAVRAFVRAIAQAEAFIHNNPDQTTVLTQQFFKFDQQTSKAIYAAILPVTPLSPLLNSQGYAAANDFHLKVGLISTAVPYQNVVATDTISKALA